MKKNYVLSVIILFTSLLTSQQIFSQAKQNPFAVKQKVSTNNTHNQAWQPAPLSALPNAQSRQASFQHTGFNPKTHPFIQPNTMKEEQFSKISHDENGLLIFAESKPGFGKYFNARSDESIIVACFSYLEDIKKAMRIDEPAVEFAEIENWNDELGMTHIKMQQFYKGVKVYGGQVILHGQFDAIDKMNGTYFPTPKLDNVQPSISINQSIEIAINDLRQVTFYNELNELETSFLDYEGPETELIIYHDSRNLTSEQLAYRITVRPNLIEHWVVYIDAKTGAVIDKYNMTCTDGPATAQAQDLNGVTQTIHTYQLNNQYYLMDASRPMYNAGQSQLPDNPVGAIWTIDANNTNMQDLQVSHITSANNSWSNPTAVSAHNSAAITYEYFRNTHNRNSIDGQGGTIISIINVSDDNGAGLDNAFWNGQAMFYGNGNEVFLPLAGGLDVGAHEMSHGVTQHTANLEYKDQSGAINEAMSDIVGCMVDRNNWTLGETIIPANSQYYPTGAMRDMQDPHNGGTALGDGGYQPKHTSEMYTGDQDNGGVHINSGIINHAYYLLAESVSKSKAEKLYYRALSNYMTKSSQFIDCRLAFEQAAKDLYGNNSAELNAVVDAFFNVGIGDEGSGGNPSPPPGELPLNPGQDYILFVDANPNNSATAYISNTDASSFVDITETGIKRKPSITDDGSIAIFVAEDNTMRAIDLLSETFEEWQVSGEKIWDNVAVSKDGTSIAAITTEVDSSIWVYSFTRQQWAKYKLYNPTFTEGVVTYNVLYADALEWDYSGEYLIYDAYNELKNNNGDNIDYWDMGIIRVWNSGSGNWGDGDIFKLYASLPEGVNIGNPSLSKNSPYIIAFDYFDSSNNDTYVIGANLETGDIAEVFANVVLGFPNYSKNDNKLVFSAMSTTNNEVIAEIGLKSDKISPNGDPAILIDMAKWPVWFAQGQRNLTDIEEEKNSVLWTNSFPNPFSDELTILVDNAERTEIRVQLFNIYGQLVRETYESGTNQKEEIKINTTDLPKGTYIIRATVGALNASKKVVKTE